VRLRAISRRAVVLVLPALFAMSTGLTGQGGASAEQLASAGAAPRGVVLLLHPGAFVWPDQTRMRRAAARLRAAGFRPVYVDYTLLDPAQAWKDTKAAAERTRAEYAYGESAGGVLAGLLVRHGLVSAAVVNSGIPDLTTPQARVWLSPMKVSYAQARALSPALAPARAPALALSSAGDFGFVRASQKQWARQDPLVRYGHTDGGHIYGATLDSYPRILDRVTRFLSMHGPSVWLSGYGRSTAVSTVNISR
jgi:hypothetical protein